MCKLNTVSMQYVMLLVISLAHCHLPSAIHLGVDNLYASPCPDTFNYFLQDGVLQYGIITVNNPDETNIQLHVELSVGNNVQGYNGDLKLASSRSQTIQNILQRKPIMYRLNFPHWYNYPPKVTKITLNGRQICQGTPIDIKAVRILTTINLQHTLKLNIPQEGYGFPPGPIDKPFKPDIDFQPSMPNDTNVTFYGGGYETASTPVAPSWFNPHRTQNPQYNGDQRPPAIAESPNAFPHVVPQVDRGGFNKYGVNSDSCGISFNTNTLIANGRAVPKGQYPWLVAIFVQKGLGPEFLCGANLVSHKHVITAGHCMKTGTKELEPKQIFMRIGEHNIHQWTQIVDSRTVGASRIVLHPDYKVMSADGDIALIVMNDEVQFTKYIRPICLWTDDVALERVVGQLGTVVGWGKDEGDNLITPEPKQIKFPIVSQEDCLRSHFTFREITSSRTFCGGFKNGSGPCNGDSGGGFILERRNRWTLRGIVSMSIAKDRTCDFSQYFVFADVTMYLDWILSNL